MQGAGDDFLAGAGFPGNEDRCRTVCQYRDEIEHLLHGRVVAGQAGVFALEGGAQGFDLAEVAKGLDAAENPAVLVSEHGGGDAAHDGS